MRLKDKVAIVTGSGRGLGKGIAMKLAEEGAKVVVADMAPADDTVAEIVAKGGDSFGFCCKRFQTGRSTCTGKIRH